MTLVDFTLDQFLLFTLLLFRVTGMMLTAPVFGSPALPTQLKVGLAMLLCLPLLPLVAPSVRALPDSLGGYLLAALAESATGMILGFAAALLFAAVQLAGMLIDQELGMSLANVIDPLSNEQVSVVGLFKLLLATALFLAIDGHHMLLSAVADSFRLVPVAGFRFSPQLGQTLGDELVGNLFSIGVRLAAPTVVTMLLTTIAMAFLARAVPEMNVFIVGFSVRILVGFGVILVAVGVFAGVFTDIAAETRTSLGRLATLMR